MLSSSISELPAAWETWPAIASALRLRLGAERVGVLGGELLARRPPRAQTAGEVEQVASSSPGLRGLRGVGLAIAGSTLS